MEKGGGWDGGVPVGDHLDEADGDEDLDHAAAGSLGPGIEGKLEIQGGGGVSRAVGKLRLFGVGMTTTSMQLVMRSFFFSRCAILISRKGGKEEKGEEEGSPWQRTARQEGGQPPGRGCRWWRACRCGRA